MGNIPIENKDSLRKSLCIACSSCKVVSFAQKDEYTAESDCNGNIYYSAKCPCCGYTNTTTEHEQKKADDFANIAIANLFRKE